MMFAVGLSAVLVLLLAWANGANDVAKGVATLSGSGAASAKRAIVWGSACTVLGGVTAVWWGASLLRSFGSEYVAPSFHIDLVFIISVLMGACTWVLAASRFSLPVSTTHALLGGVVGAVLVFAGPDGLHAAVVANKALLPLLLSPLLAIGLCAAILWIARYVASKVPAWQPGCCEPEEWKKNPFVCAQDNAPPLRRVLRTQLWTTLHWLSSGTTSFARGLNDTPKIAAFLVLAIAFVPETSAVHALSSVWLVLAVSMVMGLGGLWGGYQVLNMLSYRVASMQPGTGLVANTGTSLLVLAATPLGFPVSTTHVSVGALMGVRWAGDSRPAEGDALKLILLGWLITLPAAGAVAAAVSLTLHALE
jgi:PiT family inorganic phosphate transporter